MGLGNAKVNHSVPAAADLQDKRHYLITLGGAVAGAGVLAFPLENDQAAPTKEPAVITVAGVAPVIYGANVAKLDALTPNGTGKAIKAVAGNQICGYAMEAGADGEIGSMLVLPNGKA